MPVLVKFAYRKFSMLSRLAVATFLVALPYVVALTTNVNDVNSAKFTRFRCIVYDKVLIVNDTCTIKHISRNKTIINLYGVLTRQVNILKAHLQIFKKTNHVFKPFLVDVKENFCHLFTRESSTPYLRMLYRIAEKHINLNHTCPYKGAMIIKDLPMNADKMRLMWPNGEYRVDLSAIADNDPKPVVTFQIVLEFGEMNFQ